MLHLSLLFQNVRVGSSEFPGYVAISVLMVVVLYGMPDSFLKIGWRASGHTVGW